MGQRDAPPVVALVAGLQGSVGNRAVARLLAGSPARVTRPALQRLTEDDVEDILADKKGRKKVWDEAKKLYGANLGFGGPFYDLPGIETWDYFVKRAADVADLLKLVKESVQKAAAQRASAAPSSSPTPSSSSPKPVINTPSPASSSPVEPKEFKDKPATLPSHGADDEPKKPKPKKATKYTPLDLASLPLPSPSSAWAGGPSAAVTTPSSVGTVVPAPKSQTSGGVSKYTKALNEWDPHGHHGVKATSLTLTEATEIVTYAKNSYKRKNAVFVIKGPGSGEYSDRVQLKIVHKTLQAPGSTKKATFHLTLKQDVYDALALEERDE